MEEDCGGFNMDDVENSMSLNSFEVLLNFKKDVKLRMRIMIMMNVIDVVGNEGDISKYVDGEDITNKIIMDII